MAIKHLTTAEFAPLDEGSPSGNGRLLGPPGAAPARCSLPRWRPLPRSMTARSWWARSTWTRSRSWPANSGVMSIPTVVFLKNGVEFDRKVGVMPGEVFTGILDNNL